MDIKMKPIGYIRSSYQTREGITRQSALAQDETAVLEMLSPYEQGITDIEAGSHIIILFNFHLSQGYELRSKRHGKGEPVGVFSTRSPSRPNGIGMSIVKVLENDGKNITFAGVDMLDGTPVLDIKPYNAELNPQI